VIAVYPRDVPPARYHTACMGRAGVVPDWCRRVRFLKSPPRDVDSRPCEHCGGWIPKPRKAQRACSAGCRWALWKAGRQREADARAARDREVRELLQAALRRLGD
jgi:hypothetical protein